MESLGGNNMKKILFSLTMLIELTLSAQQKDYPIQVVSFNQVHFNDNFWLPRIKTNHTVTIPASFERCESTGRVKNFEMAATHTGKFCTVYPCLLYTSDAADERSSVD